MPGRVDRPLFPNYVFVQVHRRESVRVLQVPGVLSIVSAGREPAAFPTRRSNPCAQAFRSVTLSHIRTSRPARKYALRPVRWQA